MGRTKIVLLLFAALCLAAGCAEEYYSSPEKTLERYVNSRMMMNRNEYESCLNAFTTEDREWFEKNYIKLCAAMYGQDCPGENLSSAVTVWTDVFEPKGPKSSAVESSLIDKDKGVAVLVVNGQELHFVKRRGNWKLKGFFGAEEELAQKYPQIAREG